MNRLILSLVTLLFIFPGISFGQKNLPSTEEKELMAAKQVIMRLIGMKAESFKFEKIPDEKGLDVFEVIALDGKVLVKGSSTIAMTRGAYEYLRSACNIQYNWSTDKVTPPSSFPDLTIPRTVSPYKHRLYYNVCAYGYTNPFWKWEQWQKELDWMALHGINMPIAMAGQEAVWHKVYSDMGMTDLEIRSHFTGPAFLPWQRMGNVNKHAGPLPSSYIDASKELQKQVMIRMQQLGMDPVVPAFSGFVPAAYKRIYPDSKILDVKGWCNFPDSNQAYILPPGSSDFINIGKRFIEEYNRTYGKVHYYLADLFNENEVPVTAANKSEELADFGKSVYDAINAGDPEGTWVMQGWLFYNNRTFWNNENVKSFLSKIPNDRMIIIDLANESFHGWEQIDSFYGKPWIYSIIHNYGGSSQWVGNLPLYATDAAKMLNSPAKGNISGFGISPEGVLNNEVVYELLTDVSWTSKPVDIKAWLKAYTEQRYGVYNENLLNAWMGLLESVYSIPTAHPLNKYQNRPSMSPGSNLDQSRAFDQAVAIFLQEAEAFKNNPGFKNDLIQLVVQFAGMKTDLLIDQALLLHKQGNTTQSQLLFGKVQELMLMMDGLMHNLPQQRLENWIEDARKWGTTPAERDFYESNAKRQLTMWGNKSTPVLYEYASKVWSGLIREYYMNRWMNYADALKNGKQPAFDNWEEDWINTPGLKSKAPVTGDVLTYARLLYNTAGEFTVKYLNQVNIKSRYKGNNQAEITLAPNHLSPDQAFTAVVAAAEKTKKPVVAPKGKTKVVQEEKTQPSVQIFYTTNGSKPGPTSLSTQKPFTVELPAVIKAQAYYNDQPFGEVNYLSLPLSFGKTAVLNSAPSTKYPGNGGSSITDGIFGTTEFNTGNWLGFEGINLHATINLEKTTKIKSVTISYLENGNSWIFGPSALVVHVSNDGITYTPVYTKDFDTHYWSASAVLSTFTANFTETEAKFVKVNVYNQGICPDGSQCAGKKSWLFVDEIKVD
ncbi:MAG: alpha-N-acetylglucosaminidase C-terminal domain-containing protein [Bacteroidales bacterium]|nr:alpha-N-acetylglucosaminidase C-terminal domain-containing protein [Bacteroidales bacterium]